MASLELLACKLCLFVGKGAARSSISKCWNVNGGIIYCKPMFYELLSMLVDYISLCRRSIFSVQK